LLEVLAYIVSTISLVEDARRDGDQVATEIARRWAGPQDRSGSSASTPRKDESAWDKRIAFSAVETAEQARL
jgi:hypothetical protein